MYNSNNIAAIIPARYNSTRLPGKVLSMIGDKAMLHHVYDRAINSSLFSKVLIATDHVAVKEYCEARGLEVRMTDTKHQSGTERVEEASRAVDEDYIVNIQADEPYITQEHLSTTCTILLMDNVKIATLKHEIRNATELHDFSNVKIVTDVNDDAIYFSRQAIPGQRELPYREWLYHHKYYKHIGVYGYQKETLQKLVNLRPSQLELTESLEQLRWLENGFKIKVGAVKSNSIGVDTHDDLLKARKLYKSEK